MRYTGKEIMDGPEIIPGSFEKAYEDIGRCNRMLGGHLANLKEVKRLINRHKKESYTIWDLGSGDGGTLRYLQKRLKKDFKDIDFQGFDLSELSVNIARRKSAAMSNISFHQKDILRMDRERLPDIILCNLTLHHFSDEEAKELLGKLTHIAGLGVVVNDLERHPWAYGLFKLFSFFFIRTSIARNDGLVSIRRSFRLEEFKNWSLDLPGSAHRLYTRPLFRLIWVLESPQPSKAYQKHTP